MNPHEESLTQASDRRRHRRLSTQAQVRLTVQSGEVLGEVENLSRSGLLFFSQGDLHVRVEIEENGKATSRTGRLVRAQRMRGSSYGWAIEFDP
jgi:DnaJ-class molecular chaperone